MGYHLFLQLVDIMTVGLLVALPFYFLLKPNQGDVRVSTTLSAKKFKRKICRRECGFCIHPVKDSFCYNRYRAAPSKFMKSILPALTALDSYWDQFCKDRKEARKTFRMIFCEGEACAFKGSRVYCNVSLCFEEFMEDAGKISTRAGNRSYTTGVCRSYTQTSYTIEPVFFSDDDSYWEKCVAEHNSIEQNKG